MRPWQKSALLAIIPASVGLGILIYQGLRPSEQGGAEAFALALILGAVCYVVFVWKTRD